ncbi:MAG: hypothetical protein IJ604_05585 [Prevotella sp.]|nr:hypothetical protein [Prevotella sp.]
MRKSLIIILLAAIAFSVNAQVQVETKIDSIEILIGEQTNLTLSVAMKKGQSLQMPEFTPSQYITPGVEVLSSNPADTAVLDDHTVRVNKVYTLTSFDENLYYLPEMTVKVDGKEYKSKSLALKVITMPVDTLHPENFFPPKDVQDNPFLWSEWSGIFWLSVLVVLLFCVAFYLHLRLKQNKPIIAHVRIVKKVLPHQKAMSEIEKIKEERMVSSEDQKAYYTRLTDTLRKYIEERFGFNAMEMTSSEIIERLQQAEDRRMIDELRELFTTADLVKFAKYSTLINENDANLVNAIEFINTTKMENMPTTERVEPQLTETEMRSMRSRTALKWTIRALIILASVLFVSVLYHVYLVL